MDIDARFSQTVDLQLWALVGSFQGPVVEPLGDDGAVVDPCTPFRGRGEDEFGVREGGLEGLGSGDVGFEERRTEFVCVGAASVEDDLFWRWSSSDGMMTGSG